MRIINIDTPTFMATPTNTNIPKHTQNSYGMCYLHTTNIFHPALLVILFIYLILFWLSDIPVFVTKEWEINNSTSSMYR
jgi:hypothetical protein